MSTQTFSELAKIVVEKAHGRVIVGIDGGGGAGKSWFANRLATEFEEACIVSMDDFYLPLSDGAGSLFDVARLETQVLAPARSSVASNYQTYDWNTARLGGWVAVDGQRPLVVEGVRALDLSLRGYYSFRVWIDTPRAIRLQRGLERDGEQARMTWEVVWMPADDRYFHGQRPDLAADLVVSGCPVDSSGTRFEYRLPID